MLRALFWFALAQILPACGTDTALDSTGLPCDVQHVLENDCQSCHGTPPSAGAPMPLVSYADLAATNADGLTVAQRCVARMTNAASQMPPLPAVAAASTDIAVMQAWVAAGMPTGTCSNGPTCTSGNTWTRGNSESPQMHPGVACIHCHSSGEGPRFKVAGTVYPSAHEPDDCFGATGATVEVTGANGVVTRLQVNSAGNFYSNSTAIVFPIQVAVVANGLRRAMTASPSSGDCNTCHTRDGANLAPGRIMLP